MAIAELAGFTAAPKYTDPVGSVVVPFVKLLVVVQPGKNGASDELVFIPHIEYT